MRIRNVSPLGAIDLPLFGGVVEAGAVFDIADHLGSALLAQRDNYQLVESEDKP